MSKLSDIRTQATVPAPASGDDALSEWLKANRHKFGPFKPGTVVHQVGDEFRAVHIPQPEEQLTKEQAQMIRDTKFDEKSSMLSAPKLQVPKPVNFNDLPEEKKQAILKSNKEAVEKLEKAGLGIPEGITPIQSEQPDTPKNAGLPSDIASGPDILTFMQKFDQKKVEATQSNPTDEEKIPSAGAIEEPAFCQHCGWDRTKPDPETPDELDKLNFIQAILGQIPFKKVYDLIGGRVQVVFRTLSSSESDMAFTQVAYDVGKGAVLDEGQYFRTITDYRMCLGLSVFKNGSEIIELPDGVDEWKTDEVPVKATKLIHIVPVIYSRVIRAESIRRAVAACFFRFQRLVEHMEAHFDDPNFWPAIEKQA